MIYFLWPTDICNVPQNFGQCHRISSKLQNVTDFSWFWFTMLKNNGRYGHIVLTNLPQHKLKQCTFKNSSEIHHLQSHEWYGTAISGTICPCRRPAWPMGFALCSHQSSDSTSC